MQSIDSMIEVLQAYKNGKKIEWKGELDRKWTDFPVNNNGPWDFDTFEYRVKKETLVKWVAVDDNQDIVFSSSSPYMVNAWIKNQKGIYRAVKLVEDSEHEPQ